jgi:hypothetical protein
MDRPFYSRRVALSLILVLRVADMPNLRSLRFTCLLVDYQPPENELNLKVPEPELFNELVSGKRLEDVSFHVALLVDEGVSPITSAISWLVSPHGDWTLERLSIICKTPEGLAPDEPYV